MNYGDHVRDFESHARLRAQLVEVWPTGGRLEPALVRSLQRFQAGEDGDGASLIAKSAKAGDHDYLSAVRLFVAEEQNHARLLKNVLAYAGQLYELEQCFLGNKCIHRAVSVSLSLDKG